MKKGKGTLKTRSSNNMETKITSNKIPMKEPKKKKGIKKKGGI